MCTRSLPYGGSYPASKWSEIKPEVARRKFWTSKKIVDTFKTIGQTKIVSGMFTSELV
jgi:hypothetical protein